MIRSRLCGLLLLSCLMSPVNLLMAQEPGAPAEQTPSAPPPTQPAPQTPPESSKAHPAESSPPTETPPPQTVQPTTPESTAPPPASSEPAQKNEAPSQPAVPSEEAGSSTENVPPPPSPAKPPEAPPSGNVYKNYFAKGTLRIGGGSNLSGNITQFNKTDTSSESLSISVSSGYFVLDNLELVIEPFYEYEGLTLTNGTIGHATSYGFLVGPTYYFNFSEIVVPFVGGSLGWEHTQQISFNATEGERVQIEAGLKFLVAPAWSLDITGIYSKILGDFDEDRFFGTFGFSFYLR